ncbi:hypothetical protein ACJVDH_05565 [Pedobacter sp. AW1-32]|uniref:hypothetical protein n=1 Tax=Pedobacter sp. AW1-32 TaxID=3383026 RepID=UPI003FF1538D
MRKYLFILTVCVIFLKSKVQSQTIANSNVPGISPSPTDAFMYKGKSVSHYGLGWYNEAPSDPPTGYFSSFSGVRVFTQGIPYLNISRYGLMGLGIEEPISKFQIAGDEMITMGNYESGNGVKGIQFTGFRDILPNYFGASIEAVPEWVCCGIYPGTGYPGIKNIGLNFNVHGPSQDVNDKQTALAIKSNGNMGIGTTSPRSKLDIWAGELYVTGKDVNGTALVTSRNGMVYFANNEVTSGLAIAANGDIGIGTSTPKDKLSVNGNIRAREIKVDSENWPDYVFEENYKITPLADLETYIKQHKHLPDMPSAKEIESNGASLGELVKLQQQKIEELTLHLIEKDKQINSQSEAFKQLLERVEQLEKNK